MGCAYDKLNSMCVGVSLENIDPSGGNFEISYSMSCGLGHVYGPNGYKEQYSTNFPHDGLPLGSLCSVRLDIDKKTLTFGLNGKWNDKPAIIDVPSNTWYPYVLVVNSCVSIIRV
jgi:hypothetical protein